MHALLKQIKDIDETQGLADQTVDTGGSFDREPPKAGWHRARFIQYVEVGKRPQEYQGKAKAPCAEVRLGFQLLNPADKVEYENAEGNTVVSYPIVYEKLAIKGGDKAWYAKLLKAMAYGRDIKHMAAMLNEPFLIKIEHNKGKNKKGEEQTYANMRNKDIWFIQAPRKQTDPLDESSWQDIPVPEAHDPLQLLMFEHPTIEQWNSIFIEGSRTKKGKDGEPDEEVSLNWLQEDIMANALNFEGSQLQTLILNDGAGLDLDGGQAEAEAEAASAKASAEKKTAASDSASKTDAAVEAVLDDSELDETQEDEDPLAGLDL